MKLPTLDAFYLNELATAAGASVNQLETWITRKQFIPYRKTEPGRSRRFVMRDAERAAVMAYLTNKCGLPVGVGACVADMLRGQPELFADMRELQIYVLVFADAALHQVGRLPSEAAAQAITFAVQWDGRPGSVAHLLRDRDPTGVTIVNLSRVVSEAGERLLADLNQIVADNSTHAAIGHPLYDDTEE